MAESEGVEPSIRLLTRYSLSRGAPSATRPTLRKRRHTAAINGSFYKCRFGNSDDYQTAAICLRLRARMIPPYASDKNQKSALAAAFILFFLLNALVNFFAVHRYIFWRIDAKTHLIAFHTQHSHGYFIANNQCFTDTARQNQHSLLLMPSLFSRDTSNQCGLVLLAQIDRPSCTDLCFTT